MGKNNENAIKAELATVVDTSNGEVVSDVVIPEGFEGKTEVEGLYPVVTFNEPGAYIAGRFIRAKQNVGPNNSMLYIIELPRSKKRASIWGSAVLDSKIMDSGIKPGQRLMVQRMEDIPSKVDGQNDTKNFRVIVG